MLTAAIFDVDGVLLASPHERAWRDALVGFSDADRFTTALYQAEVAGMLWRQPAIYHGTNDGLVGDDHHILA